MTATSSAIIAQVNALVFFGAGVGFSIPRPC